MSFDIPLNIFHNDDDYNEYLYKPYDFDINTYDECFIIKPILLNIANNKNEGLTIIYLVLRRIL